MENNELLESILKSKRPELLTDDYKNHYVYNDNRKQYERIPKNIAKVHEVCNIESFAKAVISSGIPNYSLVIFNENGAVLFVDDSLADDQDKWIFSRKYTNLWNVIRLLVREESFTHKDLLNKLESVKNCIVDFESLYQKLSKLRASKKISFASNPIFTDGETSGAYEWEQKIDSDHTEKASCPSKISFKGKIVRGSEAVYEFSINLTPVIDEENGKILFKLFMPTVEMVLDQVREDEYTDFLKLIGEDLKKQILILRNY